MKLQIRQAKPGELSIAMQMLQEAAVWLSAKGVDYWQNWRDPTEPYIAWIRQGFENNEFYFACDAQEHMVGMFRLQYEDVAFWGERHDKAGYVHSFTTKRTMAGQNIGKSILEHIENTLTAQGASFLRLDCSPDIAGLCQYYEEYGFVDAGEVEVHGEKLRLYQKPI